MKSMALFQTLIYHGKLFASTQARKINQELISEISIFQEQDLAGQKWSKAHYPAGYTSYGSLDRFYNLSSSFADLKNKIDFALSVYLKDLGVAITSKHLAMNTMWVNVMPPGAFHSLHFHPHSVISGTYYVDTPKNASAIKFEDPRMGLFMNAPAKSKKSKHQNFYSVNPEAGDLVLFESWLKHEVPLNKSKTPRVSISFNYNWKNS